VQEYTISNLSTAVYKEKGSSFLAIVQPVSIVNDIKSKLINLKEEYPDANHICYAYRIKLGQRLDEFSSDAGEPIGSAGQPIINALKRQNLLNAAIFVIRYFGGTKLGIPGLIHAYKTAAEDAMQNAQLALWFEKKRIMISYPYVFEGVMKSILQNNQVEVIEEDFGEKIEIQIEIDINSADALIDIIKEKSSGSAQIKMGD